MVGEINWNLLNPNTPAQVAGSFQQGQANRLVMQQAEQEKAANALALQSKQQTMADEQAVRQAYAQSGGDPNKLVESLRGAGQHQKAAAQRKAQIEEGLQHIQVIGQLAGGVQDQATYDAARKQIAALYGPEAAAKMPEVYDPNAVNQFRTQALNASQQLEQQWKALDYGMKREQFGFEKQKFGAQQGLEREKMRQSAAQHAASQAQGKIPSGFRQTSDGNLEAIPGGPADIKTQRANEMQSAGATDVGIAISTLRDAYDRLEKGGGITSSENSPLSNAPAYLSSTGAGQIAGKMFGTQNQSARNDIAMTRPVLLAALMKATGMSAKQMDSNAELKLWLATATDPTLDVESNKRALNNIERKYISGNDKNKAGTLPTGWSVEEH